jgi:hypothetical protein
VFYPTTRFAPCLAPLVTAGAAGRGERILRGQIKVEDVQIKDLTERAPETNHLTAGLQKNADAAAGPADPTSVTATRCCDQPSPFMPSLVGRTRFALDP